nr:unnamed protein product [Callosobruchus chinensis]
MRICHGAFIICDSNIAHMNNMSNKEKLVC